MYKALAHTNRLAILRALAGKELSVDVLTKKLDLRKANVSQHLAVLRHAKLVRLRKDGTRVHYRVSDPDVLRASLVIQRFFIPKK
jgi:ArsR family transcriptional regulator